MGLVCQKSCPQRKVPLPPSSTISCSISSVKYRDLGAPSPFIAQCWLTWSYTMVCRQAQLSWVESCCSQEHAQKSPFPLHLSVLTLLQPTLLWFFPWALHGGSYYRWLIHNWALIVRSTWLFDYIEASAITITYYKIFVLLLPVFLGFVWLVPQFECLNIQI